MLCYVMLLIGIHKMHLFPANKTTSSFFRLFPSVEVIQGVKLMLPSAIMQLLRLEKSEEVNQHFDSDR